MLLKYAKKWSLNVIRAFFMNFYPIFKAKNSLNLAYFGPQQVEKNENLDFYHFFIFPTLLPRYLSKAIKNQV